MQIEVIIEKKSHKLDAEEGKTILETLQEHGIHVLTAPCGGRGRCGKCTVEVEHMGEVLACMTKVTDGMRITIPKVQLRAQKSKIAENGTVTHYPADDGEALDAARDIGTTTVVCHLIDGKTGEKLATVSEPSAQRSFGADVLSRIQAAEAGKLEILKEQIIFQIAQMLRTLQKKTGRGELIQRLAVVGNTVMCHLFAGISPVSIGVTPFIPQEFFGKEYTGNQLGLTDSRSVSIAPAVAGFVPEGFVQKHPDTQFRHMRWGGFDEEYNAYVLPPDSPFFEEIGKLYVEEWEKEFGETTYYLSDSFNEMELPIDKEDKEAKYKLLAEYGETIYKSIAAGNPDAVWVTQGWTFGYQHSFWDKESLKALLSNVPDDKMIIIDLGNDYPKWVWNTEQTWKVHDGFYGKKWIFSYVPNFGGKNTMTGDLDMYASSSVKALRAANKGNLIGFGSAPEGLENNEDVYELLADMGWSSDSIDLDDWMKIYCEARYGGYPDAMEEAWKLLRKTAYSSLYSYPRFTWQTVIPDQRRISKIDLSDDYLQAIRLYASCADELKSSELYRNDLIEFVSYYVAAKAENFYKQALKDDSENRVLAAQRNLQQTVDLLMDVDRLLASHPLYRLEEWVELARNSGTTLQEKDAYEANAKRLITSWGGIQEDYAARFWSGLIKDYYIPRIQLYFTKDRNKIREWEEQWITSPWINSTTPFDDPVEAALNLIEKTNK